jgi:hypothetical protein
MASWWSTSSSFWKLGMGILALGADERVAEVSFTDSALSVALKDGRLPCLSPGIPGCLMPRLSKG